MKAIIYIPKEKHIEIRKNKVVHDNIDLMISSIKNSTLLPKDHKRLIAELEGKSAEEIYEFLNWLLHDYGMRFTDTRLAVINWLKGKSNGDN